MRNRGWFKIKKIENKERDIKDILREEMIKILHHGQRNLKLDLYSKHKPTILFVVGVNGAGKTTTISKLCKLYQKKGRKIVLGAADCNF